MFYSDSSPPGRSVFASIAHCSLCFCFCFYSYLDSFFLFPWLPWQWFVFLACCPDSVFLLIISYPDFLCFAFVAPWQGVCFLGVGFCFSILYVLALCVSAYLATQTLCFLFWSCSDGVFLILCFCGCPDSVFLLLWLPWECVFASVAALTVCFCFCGCPDSVFLLLWLPWQKWCPGMLNVFLFLATLTLSFCLLK